MLNVTILCVGGLKERFWKDACAEYIKRLGAWSKISIVEIPEEHLPDHPSQAQISAALDAEGEKIIRKLPGNAYICALCVEGEQADSVSFSKIVKQAADEKGALAFIIGGSFGLSPRVKEAANRKLSLSAMTFPHMIARVLVLEQLYRALNILAGGKYHK